MNYLKTFLVVSMILSTGGLKSQSYQEWLKQKGKELSNLRIMCVSNKVVEMSSKEIYNYLGKNANPVLKSADNNVYTFQGVSYLYEFNFDIQQASENRYEVKITSTELDKKNQPIAKTEYSKTYYVNVIRKSGEEFKGYDINPPHRNITQDQYNKMNTMKLTNMYCWLFEADHWGVK